MSSTFGGLELGRSALNAFRLGMQTVGHNISNMNTEGYSRQRVNYTTVKPEDIYGVGQLGNLREYAMNFSISSSAMHSQL